MAYSIQDQATGRALDSNANGNVYTSQVNAGDYQKWTFLSSGSTSTTSNLFVQDVATGLFLDGNGANVYMNPYNGGTYQRWDLLNVDDSYYVIKHVESGQVLDSNADGNVYFNSLNGGHFQVWNVGVTAEELRSQLKAPPVPALPR